MDAVRPVCDEVRAHNALLVELKSTVETFVTTLNTQGVTTERLTAAFSQLQGMLQTACGQQNAQQGGPSGGAGIAGMEGVSRGPRVGAVNGVAFLAAAASQVAEAARHKEVQSACDKKRVLLEEAAKNNADKSLPARHTSAL